MSQSIHVVCLDCPSPPNYGGAIDMFYKIMALHEAGCNVILHYFDYKPSRTPAAIARYCSHVFAYKRRPAALSLPLTAPYIVRSRMNSDLVNRLNGDDYPILLEGLHCSGIMGALGNSGRVVLRMHNDEAAYYRALSKGEKNLGRRFYYWWESRRLHAYQKKLDKTITLAPLSTADKLTLEKEYGFTKNFFLPTFLPWQQLTGEQGKGDYCLYQGNLSVAENKTAAAWLIRNIFARLPVPFVIAGKDIPEGLCRLTKKHPHIRFVNNPPDDEMSALIRDAHIHLLPSFNTTGVKLKLLNALFNGRFCLTNAAGVQGTGINAGVQVCNEVSEWLSTITRLMERPFSAQDVEERSELITLYNNRENAQDLIAQWTHCR